MNSTTQTKSERCDCCGALIDGYHAIRGDLKGLCAGCCNGLISGKASARIVVQESKAMAQRASERRACR